MCLYILRCLSRHVFFIFCIQKCFPSRFALLLHFRQEHSVSASLWSDISAVYGRRFDGEMSDRECKVFCEIGCGMTLPGTDKNGTFQLCHLLK